MDDITLGPFSNVDIPTALSVSKQPILLPGPHWTASSQVQSRKILDGTSAHSSGEPPSQFQRKWRTKSRLDLCVRHLESLSRQQLGCLSISGEDTMVERSMVQKLLLQINQSNEYELRTACITDEEYISRLANPPNH
jgi:hypothetical protein